MNKEYRKKINEINSRTGSKSETLFRRIIPYITPIWHRIIYTPFCFRYVILIKFIGSKKKICQPTAFNRAYNQTHSKEIFNF